MDISQILKDLTTEHRKLEQLSKQLYSSPPSSLAFSSVSPSSSLPFSFDSSSAPPGDVSPEMEAAKVHENGNPHDNMKGVNIKNEEDEEDGAREAFSYFLTSLACRVEECEDRIVFYQHNILDALGSMKDRFRRLKVEIHKALGYDDVCQRHRGRGRSSGANGITTDAVGNIDDDEHSVRQEDNEMNNNNNNNDDDYNRNAKRGTSKIHSTKEQQGDANADITRREERRISRKQEEDGDKEDCGGHIVAELGLAVSSVLYQTGVVFLFLQCHFLPNISKAMSSFTSCVYTGIWGGSSRMGKGKERWRRRREEGGVERRWFTLNVTGQGKATTTTTATSTSSTPVVVPQEEEAEQQGTVLSPSLLSRSHRRNSNSIAKELEWNRTLFCVFHLFRALLFHFTSITLPRIEHLPSSSLSSTCVPWPPLVSKRKTIANAGGRGRQNGGRGGGGGERVEATELPPTGHHPNDPHFDHPSPSPTGTHHRSRSTLSPRAWSAAAASPSQRGLHHHLPPPSSSSFPLFPPHSSDISSSFSTLRIDREGGRGGADSGGVEIVSTTGSRGGITSTNAATAPRPQGIEKYISTPVFMDEEDKPNSGRLEVGEHEDSSHVEHDGRLPPSPCIDDVDYPPRREEKAAEEGKGKQVNEDKKKGVKKKKETKEECSSPFTTTPANMSASSTRIRSGSGKRFSSSFAAAPSPPLPPPSIVGDPLLVLSSYYSPLLSAWWEEGRRQECQGVEEREHRPDPISSLGNSTRAQRTTYNDNEEVKNVEVRSKTHTTVMQPSRVDTTMASSSSSGRRGSAPPLLATSFPSSPASNHSTSSLEISSHPSPTWSSSLLLFEILQLYQQTFPSASLLVLPPSPPSTSLSSSLPAVSPRGVEGMTPEMEREMVKDLSFRLLASSKMTMAGTNPPPSSSSSLLRSSFTIFLTPFATPPPLTAAAQRDGAGRGFGAVTLEAFAHGIHTRAGIPTRMWARGDGSGGVPPPPRPRLHGSRSTPTRVEQKQKCQRGEVEEGQEVREREEEGCTTHVPSEDGRRQQQKRPKQSNNNIDAGMNIVTGTHSPPVKRKGEESGRGVLSFSLGGREVAEGRMEGVANPPSPHGEEEADEEEEEEEEFKQFEALLKGLLRAPPDACDNVSVKGENMEKEKRRVLQDQNDEDHDREEEGGGGKGFTLVDPWTTSRISSTTGLGSTSSPPQPPPVQSSPLLLLLPSNTMSTSVGAAVSGVSNPAQSLPPREHASVEWREEQEKRVTPRGSSTTCGSITKRTRNFTSTASDGKGELTTRTTVMTLPVLFKNISTHACRCPRSSSPRRGTVASTSSIPAASSASSETKTSGLMGGTPPLPPSSTTTTFSTSTADCRRSGKMEEQGQEKGEKESSVEKKKNELMLANEETGEPHHRNNKKEDGKEEEEPTFSSSAWCSPDLSPSTMMMMMKPAAAKRSSSSSDDDDDDVWWPSWLEGGVMETMTDHNPPPHHHNFSRYYSHGNSEDDDNMLGINTIGEYTERFNRGEREEEEDAEWSTRIGSQIIEYGDGPSVGKSKSFPSPTSPTMRRRRFPPPPLPPFQHRSTASTGGENPLGTPPPQQLQAGKRRKGEKEKKREGEHKMTSSSSTSCTTTTLPLILPPPTTATTTTFSSPANGLDVWADGKGSENEGFPTSCGHPPPPSSSSCSGNGMDSGRSAGGNSGPSSSSSSVICNSTGVGALPSSPPPPPDYNCHSPPPPPPPLCTTRVSQKTEMGRRRKRSRSGSTTASLRFSSSSSSVSARNRQKEEEIHDDDFIFSSSTRTSTPPSSACSTLPPPSCVSSLRTSAAAAVNEGVGFPPSLYVDEEEQEEEEGEGEGTEEEEQPSFLRRQRYIDEYWEFLCYLTWQQKIKRAKYDDHGEVLPPPAPLRPHKLLSTTEEFFPARRIPTPHHCFPSTHFPSPYPLLSPSFSSSSSLSSSLFPASSSPFTLPYDPSYWVFQLSFSASDAMLRNTVVKAILALGGGRVDTSPHFSRACTHLILGPGHLERSEKFLCACAAGVLMFPAEYVLECHRKGRGWLCEREDLLLYECNPTRGVRRPSGCRFAMQKCWKAERRRWMHQMALNTFLPYPHPHARLSPPPAPHYLPYRFPQQSTYLFASWKVILLTEEKRVLTGIRQVLKAGGCSFVVGIFYYPMSALDHHDRPPYPHPLPSTTMTLRREVGRVIPRHCLEENVHVMEGKCNTKGKTGREEKEQGDDGGEAHGTDNEEDDAPLRYPPHKRQECSGTSCVSPVSVQPLAKPYVLLVVQEGESLEKQDWPLLHQQLRRRREEEERREAGKRSTCTRTPLAPPPPCAPSSMQFLSLSQILCSSDGTKTTTAEVDGDHLLHEATHILVESKSFSSDDPSRFETPLWVPSELCRDPSLYAKMFSLDLLHYCLCGRPIEAHGGRVFDDHGTLLDGALPRKQCRLVMPTS